MIQDSRQQWVWGGLDDDKEPQAPSELASAAWIPQLESHLPTPQEGCPPLFLCCHREMPHGRGTDEELPALMHPPLPP